MLEYDFNHLSVYVCIEFVFFMSAKMCNRMMQLKLQMTKKEASDGIFVIKPFLLFE